MDATLTCLIPCRNERRNIRPCIESLQQIADEILIADSGSTDGTMDIARTAGGSKCRIIEREYRLSGDFKNWAIPQAQYDWVLLVDADERIPQDLATEIMSVIADPDAKDGYWIFRRNYLMGHRVRFGGLQRDSCIRLFRRDVSRYVGDTDHAEVSVSTGSVGRLRSLMDHYSYWSHDQWQRKMERYSIVQANIWAEQGKEAAFTQLLLRMPFRFMAHYFLQLGFLDGKIGLQYAILQAYYSFMKQARLWEIQHAIDQPDPEADVPQQKVTLAEFYPKAA